MALLFGNLSQDFISFASAIASAQSGDAAGTSLVAEAAREFKASASKNASYLTYIGTHRLSSTVWWYH